MITTCKGYQVIRVAQVRCESRKGEPMRFYCHEVVQRWISPDGKVTDMALLRGFLFCYCDVWALGSDMEVRPHNSLYDDVVARSCAYPKMRILPQLRRNGFKGDFHGISPVRLFKALLSDPRIETLMKGGEIEVMKHFLFNTRTADECWASYLIAKRHKYQIGNLSMWCDYIRMLTLTPFNLPTALLCGSFLLVYGFNFLGCVVVCRHEIQILRLGNHGRGNNRQGA